MHVLRQVHRALKPRGLLLDVHPLGNEIPVLAGECGVGFVDTRKFRAILEAMNKCVQQVLSKDLLKELRTLRRHVVERYDTAQEVLEEADSWENLRLPAPVRRRLQETEATPIEFIDTVRYRLLGKREEVPTSRSAWGDAGRCAGSSCPATPSSLSGAEERLGRHKRSSAKKSGSVDHL